MVPGSIASVKVVAAWRVVVRLTVKTSVLPSLARARVVPRLIDGNSSSVTAQKASASSGSSSALVGADRCSTKVSLSSSQASSASVTGTATLPWPAAIVNTAPTPV